MRLSLPKLITVILITFFCTLAVSTTYAQARTWLGVTTNWNTPTNWSGGVVPTSANAVIIPAAAFAPKLSANSACANITFTGNSNISNTTTETLTVGAIVTINLGFTAAISCPLILTTNTTFTIGTAPLAANANLTVSGVISGSFSITKLAAGTLIFSGLNTYTGITAINVGTLRLGASSSGLNSPLGVAAGGTTVANGAVLDLNGLNILTAEALTIAGTGIANSGALINNGPTASTYSGNINSTATAAIGVATNTINIVNNLTALGNLLKLGDGILNLGTGITSIASFNIAGIVNAANDVAIGVKLTIDPDGIFNMATFRLTGGFTTAGSATSQLLISTLSTTPIPSATNWFFPVVFNVPTGGQTIPGGNYFAGLLLNNVSGTQTASGNILNLPTLDMPNSTILNMAGNNLDIGTMPGTLSLSSGAIIDMGVGNLTYIVNTAMLGTVRFSGPNNGLSMLTGTIEYYGPAQIVTFGDYNNLLINQSAGNASLDLTGFVTVNGTLNLLSGSLFIGGNTLVVNGDITRTTGSFGGDATSILLLSSGTASAESLFFDPATAALGSLILAHTSPKITTLSTDLSIYVGVSFAGINDNLNFNAKHVTLKSDINGTAYIGEILGTLTGATNVTAERFMNTNKRAWRLLTIPVTGQTIRNAWAGAVANAAAPAGESAGFGTLITGHGVTYPDGSTAATAGFDWFTGLGVATTSSIRFYDFANRWASATNTPSTLSAPTKQGYLLYVRGDRTIADATSFGPATLSPTGTIKQGNITAIVNETFTVIGNPYCSPIDIDLVYQNAGNSAVINQKFYVWDATQGTGGAFNTINFAGPGLGYTSSITGGDGAPFLIANSGQAFFVEQNGVGGTITINETNKTINTPQVAFRPMGTTGTTVSSIAIKLFDATGKTLGKQDDGVVARFNDIYNVAPTEIYDAVKLNNFNENLGLLRNKLYLSIESRPFPTQSDTLFVPFWNLKTREYALSITSSKFAGLAQAARLIDAFTNTQTLLNLNDGNIIYPFVVTSDAASSSLNRFTIVFTPTTPLPVSFTNIHAVLNGSNVQVTWSTGSSEDVKNYEVEKSTDGSNFIKIGTVVALSNSTSASYGLQDEKPVRGNNFYRIRSNDKNGKFAYSNIATLALNGKKGIVVTPTIISNQHFTLSLNEQPVGNYNLLLTNSTGQQVYKKVINNTGLYNTQQINLGNTLLAEGIYNLSVSDAKGNMKNFRLLIKK